MDCNLFELDWHGPKFTWSNGHRDQTWTRLRLDRALTNSEWRDLFSEVCCHCATRCFLQRPIIYKFSLIGLLLGSTICIRLGVADKEFSGLIAVGKRIEIADVLYRKFG